MPRFHQGVVIKASKVIERGPLMKLNLLGKAK